MSKYILWLMCKGIIFNQQLGILHTIVGHSAYCTLEDRTYFAVTLQSPFSDIFIVFVSYYYVCWFNALKKTKELKLKTQIAVYSLLFEMYIKMFSWNLAMKKKVQDDCVWIAHLFALFCVIDNRAIKILIVIIISTILLLKVFV